MRSTAKEPAGKLEPRLSLIAAAQSVAIDAGLAAASVRAISALAGISASTINYHFDGVDDLLAASLDAARERDAAWRRSQFDRLPQAGLDPALFAHYLHALIDVASRAHRDLSLLRWDVALEAALHGRFVPIAARWSEDLESFWSTILQTFGISASAQLVAEFADAAGRIHLAAGASATHVAWLSETCERFALRCCGYEPPRRGGFVWRNMHRVCDRGGQLQADTTYNETARRIVEAAVKVINADGPAALTHRAVATVAGVSLSSTTYHFASRGEILRAAFAALREISVERTRNPRPFTASTLTTSELTERMGAALVPTGDVVSREYLSGQSLLHAAARDAAMKEHAQDIYAHMGEPTMRLFEATAELANEADDLDAFIFALWTDAMLLNATLPSHTSKLTYVRARQHSMLSMLLRGQNPAAEG